MHSTCSYTKYKRNEKEKRRERERESVYACVCTLARHFSSCEVGQVYHLSPLYRPGNFENLTVEQPYRTCCMSRAGEGHWPSVITYLTL